MSFKTACGAAVLWASAFLANPADAALIIQVQQVGSDVTVTSSGSINTGSFTGKVTGNSLGGNVTPGQSSLGSPFFPIPSFFASMATGPNTSFAADFYTVTYTSGPATGFGVGNFTNATSGSGSPVGIEINSSGSATASYPQSDTIYLPSGYVSGSSLVGTSTYSGQTVAGLGFVPGTYTLAFGAGATADTITVNVVPEPAALSLAVLAGGMLLLRRRRQQV